MFEPKYIKTENNQIIIFPAEFNHSQFKYLNPVSAGFIMIKNERKEGHNFPSAIIKCYGKSVTLGLDSDPEDTKLAQKLFIDYHY